MKAKRFMTLEIGAEGIRFGLFSNPRSGDVPHLLDQGVVPFAADLPDTMAREAVVAATLKGLLEDKKPACRSVRIAIDGQSVFSRLVTLPPVSSERLQQTIRHEAVQNIPFPIDEVVWDAHVADPQAAEPEVLLVAVKADLVEGLAGAMAANGLTVEAVDAAPAALANAVRQAYPESDETLLILDAGTHSSHLVFVDGPRTFMRTLPVAGGMPERLAHEVERSIGFYRNQQRGRAPARILLAGDASVLEPLAQAVQLPVETLDPFRKTGAAGVDRPEAWGVVMGLALRTASPSALQLNLIPASLKRAREVRRRRPVRAVWATAAIVLLLIGAVGFDQAAVRLKAENQAIRAEVQALESVEQELQPLEARLDELQQRSAVYAEAVQQRTFLQRALLALKQHLSDGMFLMESEMLDDEIAGEGLRITVVSYLDNEPENTDVVIQLRDALRQDPFFSDVTRVHLRPTKRLFARQFVLDLFFAEAAE